MTTHLPAVLLDRALSFQRHGDHARAAAMLEMAVAHPCPQQLADGDCGKCDDGQLAKAALILVRVLRPRGTLVYREAVQNSSVVMMEADRASFDEWHDGNASACVEACRWHLGIKRKWGSRDSDELWRDAVDSQVDVFRVRRALRRFREVP